MNRGSKATKHPDVLAIVVDSRLQLRHSNGCSGIISSCGGGVYLCQREQGGCGSIFWHKDIFPLPEAGITDQSLAQEP